MEQRKEIICRYVSQGLGVKTAVSIAGLSKSSYYYRSNGQRKGKHSTSFTLYHGQRVSNDEVVKRIEALLSENDFIDYGYQRTHQALRKEGYIINHKKVYRLMKNAGLLYQKANGSRRGSRTFVRYTTPAYTHPFATVEVDIKYIYIEGSKRNAYLLTLLDTFTRIAIDWAIGYQMTNQSLGVMVDRYLKNDLVAPYLNGSRLTLRSDNGPQFVSNNLAAKLKQLPLDQEFIRPGTPQQNGHIESFHHTIKRLITDRYAFNDLDHAKEVFTSFYQVYNEKRIMKSILYCSPIEFLKTWETGQVGVRIKNRKSQFFFRERPPLL